MNDMAATETDSPGNTAGRKGKDGTMAERITLTAKYMFTEWNTPESDEERFYRLLDRFLGDEHASDADKRRVYTVVSETEEVFQKESSFTEPYSAAMHELYGEGIDFSEYEKD